jgi:hypothetical protein
MATATDQKPESQALQKADVTAVTKLAGDLIRTPMQLAERVRALQQVAHVLSPAVAVAAIPQHIAINPVVVVIDTTVDAETGRGTDVYFQRSIHKSRKQGRGYEATYEPLEVSLNAKAILRVLASSGVKVTRSVRTDDGSKTNYWTWEACGEIREFDGSWRALPHGNVEIDLRDGSAQIGEWTSEAWSKAVAAAEERKKHTPKDDQWKVKPEPVGGWSQERVIGARKFGLRLAESKALNALGRNLGLKQIYSIEELKKPFVIFRAMWNPDMSDPETRRMVTAAELGATHLLGYPASSPAPALPASDASSTARIQHAAGDVIEGEAVGQESTAAPAREEDEDRPFAPTAAASSTAPAAADPIYHVAQVIKRKKGSSSAFAITTKETGDRLFLTNDEAHATAAHAFGQAGTGLHFSPETRNGETWLIEFEPEPKL